MDSTPSVSSLRHKPKGRWVFDEDVSACFDDMLMRSIPQYGEMRTLSAHIARYFLEPGDLLLDLGCSHGEAFSLLVEHCPKNTFLGIDNSKPMLDAARGRFERELQAGRVFFRECDLRERFPLVTAGVVFSILTLQFTPIEYRSRIVANVFNCLKPGGVFVLVEKVLGSTSDLDGFFVERHHAFKRSNGYCEQAVEDKRRALEGVLVPLTADWNMDLLKSTGFRQVDVFWRWANFCGFVAVK